MIEGEFLTTPQTHIKLGQLCRDERGKPAISVKRGKRNEYEAVPITYLITQLSEAQEYMEAQRDNTSSE